MVIALGDGGTWATEWVGEDVNSITGVVDAISERNSREQGNKRVGGGDGGADETGQEPGNCNLGGEGANNDLRDVIGEGNITAAECDSIASGTISNFRERKGTEDKHRVLGSKSGGSMRGGQADSGDVIGFDYFSGSDDGGEVGARGRVGIEDKSTCEDVGGGGEVGDKTSGGWWVIAIGKDELY